MVNPPGRCHQSQLLVVSGGAVLFHPSPSTQHHFHPQPLVPMSAAPLQHSNEKRRHEDDKDADYIPITSAAGTIGVTDNNNKDPALMTMVHHHHEIFMSRAFPPSVNEDTDNKVWCRPQQEHDYIVHVLTNWQIGVNLKQMEPGPEKDRGDREHNY